MAQNPSLSRSIGDSPMDKVNPVNDPKFANGQGYNEFDLSHSRPDTQRFADLVPFLFLEGVPGDRFLLRSDSEIKANGLTDALLSEVTMSEDYFMVPHSALYPRNWEKIFTNPTKGDDVPRAALPSFPIREYLLRLTFGLIPDSPDYSFYFDDNLYTLPPEVFNTTASFNTHSSTPSQAQILANLIRLNYITRAAFLLSPDSILSRAGFKPNFPQVVSPRSDISDTGFYHGLSFGDSINTADMVSRFFDSFQRIYATFSDNFTSQTFVIAVLTQTYLGEDLADSSFGSYKSRIIRPRSLSDLRDILYSCVNNGDIFAFVQLEDPGVTTFQFFFDQTLFNPLNAFFQHARNLATSLVDHDINVPYPTSTPGITTAYLDLSRVLAYQLAVAQYGTVDEVDYIYTSKLYLQNLESDLLTPNVASTDDNLSPPTIPTFYYNGVVTSYDILTAGYLRQVLPLAVGYTNRLFYLYANLFGTRTTLRFRDYFASSRPNVLAVGDLTVNVSNNQVQTVDITKNIVMQRFLNAANRVGSKLLNYALGIFGVKPANIDAEPHFISRRSVPINRNLVTNTSSEQGKQTTNLESSGSRYAFDIFIDESCIVLGIRSFSAVGSYSYGIDRHLTNFDRFQKFNPMIQNIGDQPIYVSELTGRSNSNYTTSVFGYTNRYGEYKNAVSYAQAGTFSTLPGWFFFYNYDRPSNYNNSEIFTSSNTHIRPSFVRLYPYMFDGFYSSLSSLAPSHYYHFTISQVNSIQALRKMDFQPGVLWN